MSFPAEHSQHQPGKPVPEPVSGLANASAVQQELGQSTNTSRATSSCTATISAPDQKVAASTHCPQHWSVSQTPHR